MLHLHFVYAPIVRNPFSLPREPAITSTPESSCYDFSVGKGEEEKNKRHLSTFPAAGTVILFLPASLYVIQEGMLSLMALSE